MKLSLASVLALGVAALAGCVPVERMAVAPSATGGLEGIEARVPVVAASRSFSTQRGDGTALVAVAVELANESDATVMVDLSRARLVVVDPAGPPEGVELAARAAGVGDVPKAVPRTTAALALPLRARARESAWVAFETESPLEDRDVPRRVVLRLPLEPSGRHVDVVLADPATARPRWEHPPITSAGYAGTGIVGRPFEEGSLSLVRVSPRAAHGRVVLGPTVSWGFRAGEMRGEPKSTIACCDLGLSFDVAWLLFRGRDGSVGPWLSYQSVLVLEEGRPDRAAWHGPAAGLQFHTKLLEPITAGAWPIRRGVTPLGYSSFTVAYVHLFRRGDAGGSPGMLATFEHTLPEL